MYRSKNRIIKVINCHNIIGVVYTFLSINLPTLLNVNIYLKKKNIFEIIIFRFDLLNTKFIFFFIYFAIYGWGNVQRVLESKTNLTKFARFYLMILSHTSIIIYHYQRCCRIPLLQPQLILTSSTSTTNTITTVTTTTTTTAIVTTTTTAAAAITTSAIIAALLLFTTYCMPSVQART